MSEPKSVDLVHGDVTKMEELVDRESLGEVCRSFYELFGLSLRVFSSSGALLADVHEERDICRQVNAATEGKIACTKTVERVRQTMPGEDSVFSQCFTGAIYHVAPIIYNDRRLGRIVLGPFLPADLNQTPESLRRILPPDRQQQALEALIEMPRAREDTSRRIAVHLQRVLQLMLFAGHRAQLTSEMHLATVRDSYRELSEKNAALQQAFERLQQLDRLKSDFLSTVSHELRTPLTSVIGYAEMLLAGIGGELNQEHQGFAEIIRSKGELLLSLITNLLDLGRLERDQVTLDLESVDAKAILKEVREILVPEAEKNRVRLEIEITEESPSLNADELRLKQILLNVTGNAIKFTPRGGVVRLSARSVEMQLRNAGDGQIGMAVMLAPEKAVEFAVRDTGIGIPKHELKNIFDAFYQVDSSSTRQYGGAGLGLTIAKKLIDAHGGNIRIESEVDRGTTVFITLPEQPPTPEPSKR